jgi:hypothetical protein
MKICATCKKNKPFTEFHKGNNKKGEKVIIVKNVIIFLMLNI